VERNREKMTTKNTTKTKKKPFNQPQLTIDDETLIVIEESASFNGLYFDTFSLRKHTLVYKKLVLSINKNSERWKTLKVIGHV
jgi:hypothetical protein